MVDNVDANFGRLRVRPRGARRLGRHDRPLHLRQRRVTRGRGDGHDVVLRPPHQPLRRRGRPRPPRRDRRAPDHPALPPGMGDGVEHAVPALQDQHPCRRSPGRARSSAGRGGWRRVGRCRRDPPPVRPRHRRPADPARPPRTRSAGGSGRGRRSSRWRDARSPPTIDDPDAPSQHREQHYEMQGHRGYYRDGWEVVTLHRPMTSFAEDRWELYDLAADPTELRDLERGAPRRRRRARRGVGAGGMGEPGLPARRGHLHQAPHPTAGHRALRRSRSPSGPAHRRSSDGAPSSSSPSGPSA